MEAESRRTLQIDPRLEAYHTFFDDGWARRFLALVKGTVVDEPAFDLLASWRAVANTHRMPMTMMKVLESLWKGAIIGQSITQRHIEQILGCLCKDVKLTVTKQHEVRRAMQRMIAKVNHAESQLDDGFPGEGIWDGFIHSKQGIEFQLSIWGSQRLCYPALYHAYEHFLRDVMSVRIGDPNYRIPRYEEFLRQAEKYLGPQTLGYCLTDADVTLARLVRNAFAHKGGKLTKELRALPSLPFEIVDDMIQIMAPDTTALFNLLKERAYRLAEVGISGPL